MIQGEQKLENPEIQYDFLIKRVVLGKRLYKDALSETKSKDSRKQSNKIIIFGGSIPRGIKVNEFNYYLKFGEAKFKCIPEASAHEMKFYVEPTLETSDFKVALLHVGINDILKNRSSPDIEKLILDIKMIIDKCKSFEVQKFIISGLSFNRKVERSTLEQVNYELLQSCLKNGYHFRDNSSINNTANG